MRKSVRVERRSGYEEITDLPSVSFGRGSMVCMLCVGYEGGGGESVREGRRKEMRGGEWLWLWAFLLAGREDATCFARVIN